MIYVGVVLPSLEIIGTSGYLWIRRHFEFVKSSKTEYVMARSIQLQHKTPEHVNVIKCYIGRLFPKLDENSEIIIPFTINPSILCLKLTLTIKTGNSITSSESIREG